MVSNIRPIDYGIINYCKLSALCLNVTEVIEYVPWLFMGFSVFRYSVQTLFAVVFDPRGMTAFRQRRFSCTSRRHVSIGRVVTDCMRRLGRRRGCASGCLSGSATSVK